MSYNPSISILDRQYYCAISIIVRYYWSCRGRFKIHKMFTLTVSPILILNVFDQLNCKFVPLPVEKPSALWTVFRCQRPSPKTQIRFSSYLGTTTEMRIVPNTRVSRFVRKRRRLLYVGLLKKQRSACNSACTSAGYGRRRRLVNLIGFCGNYGRRRRGGEQ